jgi:hypothetical protein
MPSLGGKRLDPRYIEALEFAARLHDGQMRKGSHGTTTNDYRKASLSLAPSGQNKRRFYTVALRVIHTHLA